jgi:predicted transcriptional regulator
METELQHSGTPHEGSIPHSGRYEYGSGDDPFQHEGGFRAQVAKLRAEGLSDTEVAKALGMNTKEFRNQVTLEKAKEQAANLSRAQKLKDHGYSNTKIAELMGTKESTVRGWLKQANEEKQNKIDSTTDTLKKSLQNHKYIDVGIGVERELGVARTKLDASLAKMKEEGYEVVTINVPQATNPKQYTTVKVLAPEGTTKREVFNNLQDIGTINEYTSRDGGKSWGLVEYPKSLDSKRVYIRYKEEGGIDKDGVIELRKGVEDISLGNAHYAQVRIAVDDTSYLKGMAIYSDNIPDGYDVVFNTNKSQGTPARKVFKDLKEDRDNPFGASIKANGQRRYTDENGESQLSVINKVNEEGDWDEWSRTISAQMLAKQPAKLISNQLKVSYTEKADELNDILKVQQPETRKKLLEEFASDCDSTAVHLKAAGFPNQRSQVLIPITTMKDTEIYAPNYQNGEQVALIRYPHGGIFEIPILTVNNNDKKAKSILGDAKDAVGINKTVADQLSGADFDGDTVQVIPVSAKVPIQNIKAFSGAYEALKDFDPKEQYKGYEGMPEMKEKTKQNEMGKVSNLITDMTLKGATDEEIVRAVKHSMVVIDAKKHHLDYKQSEKDNNIRELKQKYQYDPETGKGGAATIVSRAKSSIQVPKVTARSQVGISTYNTDPETGERIKVLANETYVDKKGKTQVRTMESTRMAETTDAYTLSSGTQKENLYADYANKLKALANRARKEYLATDNSSVSIVAKENYNQEVNSLKFKLNEALKNAPKERIAQIRANQEIKAKIADNPELTDEEHKADLKKERNRSLAKARDAVGSSKKDVLIKPTQKEWEAIQAGALSSTTIFSILNNMDSDDIRRLSMPNYRDSTTLPPAKQARIRALSASGHSNAEIAEALGISTSTVFKYLS